MQVPFTRRPGFRASLLRSLALLVLIGVGVAVTGWTALVAADETRAAAARAGLGFIGLAVSCAVFVVGLRLATARAVPTRWLLPGAVVAVIGLLAWFAIQAQAPCTRSGSTWSARTAWCRVPSPNR